MAIVVLLVGISGYSYSQWRLSVKNLQHEERWDESNTQFEKNYFLMKGNGRFLITWANLQYQMGNVPRSLSLLQEAEHFFCDDIFLKNMAALYEEAGEITQARQTYDKAVNIVPGAFNIAYERILFLQRIGEHQGAYQEAIKLYNKQIKSTYYADPFIIKAKLKDIINTFETNHKQ
jgi:tetratricopeptide (TPR) repeat protein